MVELSTLLDRFPGAEEILKEISRAIKAHGRLALIKRKTLLLILSDEDDPDAFIDVLLDELVLNNLERVKTCCNTPVVETDYCIMCGEKDVLEEDEYYQINKLIRFIDEWRKNLHEELEKKIDIVDQEYIRLISAQVRSLERNPIIPESERTKEKQYQFVGYRMLSPVYDVEMECLTNDGRSDLKFKVPVERIDFVGEYKIWTRRSKIDLVVDQCLNYYTSDTESSFIFMVNDSKNDIWNHYLTEQVFQSSSYVETSSLGYLATRERYGINIYHTSHKCNVIDRNTNVYHFIYDLNGNFGVR